MNREILEGRVQEGLFGPNACIVETHASWVVLGREFAWKFKKPIQFSFLDFSTLELRHFYCRRELELNRRLAPNVYLDVVALSCSDAGWSLGDGRDEVQEYALRMIRLDSSLEMDKMLVENTVTPEMMADLAQIVGKFHDAAAPVLVTSKGVSAAYFEDFADILGTASFVETALGATTLATLEADVDRARNYLQGHADLLAKRCEHGWTRDLHGDLHSANIFLGPEPVVFDCIEFNDHFRQIDVLNEIAFLCMDLDVRGHPELKSAFLEHYRAVVPCLDTGAEQALFRYFKAYRANVRAKVALLRAQQAEGEGRAKAVAEAAKYLEWMHRYIMNLYVVL